MKDICCIGHVTKDKIVTPEHTAYMAGGTSFYFAYGINRLPHDVGFQLVTKVGADQREEIERMKDAGIDVICFDSRQTVYFENTYGTNSNNRTQRVLAKSDAFTIDEVSNLEARVFHLGSLLADDFPVDVVRTLADKGRVSIDAQGYLREVRGDKVYPIEWQNMREVLALTDTLKLNEHEMEVVAGSKDPRDVARKVAAMGVREVVITLGNYGSVIYDGDSFYDIPAFEPRKLVDATGCGDTFSTGYLYMRAQGADIAYAGRFAAAMCTLKLEHSGPFEGTIKDIELIMK